MSLTDQQWCPTSVQVTVLQARGLRIKGKSGTNDAYAVIQVGKEKYQTSVVEKCVAPVWKEEASFDLPQLNQGGGGGSTLHVHVLHRALVGPDKLLGQAVSNLSQLSEDKTRNKTEWFKLLDKTGKPDKDRGELLVDIQFMRNNMTASMFDLSAAGKSRSRLGKFKDKVRGKKKESDSVTSVTSSFSQVLTDSEEEGNGDGEAATGKDGKHKKHKIKSLFSPKSNLQKSMSQSMSVLPGKNSTLSGSQSSGLNVDSSDGKKKFKFMIHKRSGSSDGKDSSSVREKQVSVEQSNLCINGSHIYCEEPPPRTSRISSNFSLASSGHGSMEDVPENSPPPEPQKAARQCSPWEEEEGGEEEDDTPEVENVKANVSESKKTIIEEDRKEEKVKRQQERLESLAEDREKLEEEETRRKEEEKIRREEEKRRREQEERVRMEEEHERLAEEKRLQDLERRKMEAEEKKKKDEEERIRIDAEKKRLEEEERVKMEERRQEEQKLAEEKRLEEDKRAQEERRQEEEAKIAEEKRLKEVERRKLEEEIRKQRDEEERIRIKEEKKRLEEEERVKMEERRRQDEQKLAEEKRRAQEEERVRKENEEKEEELLRKLEEEREKKRIQLEQQTKQREEEERVRKEEEKKRQEEEEQAKKEREEEERKLQEERKLIEAEDKFRQQERIRLEEEEKRRLKEQENQRAEEERLMKEEEKRREDEERARKQREEFERLLEVQMQQEEQRKLEEEERIRKEEEERVRMEEEMKRRKEEEEERARKEEMERLEEERRLQVQEKRRIEEEERIRREKKQEEARKLEKLRNAEEQEKRENKTKDDIRAAGKKPKVSSPAGVTSTNPFDENFSCNPFEDIPESPDSSTAEEPMVQQRCQSAVSSVGSKTGSVDEKDLISTQREKRPAPQPPVKSQAGKQPHREQDVPARHLAQINKQSKDKDVKTVSVPPQRSVQMIAPLCRSPTDSKNSQSLMQSNNTNGTTNAAKHSKRPAPSAPPPMGEKQSSDPKTSSNLGGAETKQVKVVCGLNPFEDDEDGRELTAQDDTALSSNTGPIHWLPTVSQTAEKDAASQLKIKSSKTAHAPPPPAKDDISSNTLMNPSTERSHATGDRSATAPDNGALQACDPYYESTSPRHVPVSPLQQSQSLKVQNLVEAGVKKDGAPTPSRRLQPVRPLNPLEQQGASVVQGENENKTTGIPSGLQDKTKVDDSGMKGPYSQLTREELISLVLKQENQLSERDDKISELEQYIDNLLVRVIEEKPSILMSLTAMKKAA